jgi:integrase
VEKTNKAPEVARDRELSPAELRRLWLAVDADEFSQDERDVLRLMILTLQREAQIADLKVSETDLAEKRLVYGRARVKNKQVGKHIVPLAPLAFAIVAKRDLTDRQFVFGKWDSGFRNFTHLKEKLDEIVKFNEPWVFHDLRRSDTP